ncbi:MAG TPA: class I SAM-dependent methyltransferase [Candidatus Cybelea sp.]|jgi:ubiquinone/menaquinone biosynthesis C-methylase UbiE|nr:class I SAM-dependent methyltransferase [Candidatus Cybelea sp.]
MRGQPDPARDWTALDQGEFLREWHSRFAGATSRTFKYGRVEGTRGSSYDLLVDDIASLPDADHIVDLACGDGYLIELLTGRMPDAAITGVDLSEQELNLARKRRLGERVALVIAPAVALPLANGSAAAVVSHLALMLFEDARAVIREMARVLRPRGVFAAVLGPAAGTSPMVADFLRDLREIEAAENLPPLRIGDSSTYSVESLKELFSDDEWSSIEVSDVRVRFDGPGEQAESMLLAMYNVARLSNTGRVDLARRLRQAISNARLAGESLECVLGSRHIVARR